MTRRDDLVVADVVRQSISTSVDRLTAAEPGLYEGRDPEAVHRARVATRRLRSDLRTFGAFVDVTWAAELRGELRWLGAELGAVRDIEVMRDRLHAHAALLPEGPAEHAARALHRLDDDHEAARAELLGALRQPRYVQLRAALHDAAAAPPSTHAAGTDAARTLARGVRKRWRTLRRAVRDLGRDPSDDSLHAVRIRAKRCRYAAEAAAPAFGKDALRFADALAAVQDVLGEHHDAVVASAWLAKAAHECAPGDAYALGMLAERERDSARRAHGELARTWQRARAKRLRRWL